MQDQEFVSALFDALESVLLPNSAAYVAGPLESGRKFYEDLAAGVPSPQVRQENQRRLSLFVQQLRKTLPYPVFDPGVLKVRSWSNAQHGAFFMQVIKRLAREVWFLDGWEFSVGATKEFVYSCKLGIPCRDERGMEISLQLGTSMIRSAAEYVQDLGLDASRLLSRIL